MAKLLSIPFSINPITFTAQLTPVHSCQQATVCFFVDPAGIRDEFIFTLGSSYVVHWQNCCNIPNLLMKHIWIVRIKSFLLFLFFKLLTAQCPLLIQSLRCVVHTLFTFLYYIHNSILLCRFMKIWFSEIEYPSSCEWQCTKSCKEQRHWSSEIRLFKWAPMGLF